MTKKNKKLMRTDYQAIFNKAYQLMDEALIAGNCGERCGYHCCRRIDVDGERLGIMYTLVKTRNQKYLDKSPFAF